MTRLLCRAVAGVDAVWLGCRLLRHKRKSATVTAGAGIQARNEIEFRRFGSVDWPCFPTLAHSFWRAQELTLFRRHRDFFTEPTLDLGCGDGIFAHLAGFPDTRVSVDYDLDSLMAGSENQSRCLRVQADAGLLPIRDESAAVCLSNSLLEHLPSLENCFAEVRRVLRPGGKFVLTMTLGAFSAQLLRMYGESDARRWLTAFGHHQEPDETTLTELLQDAGFVVQQKITYQPESVTAIYRLLLSPAFQFIERHCRADRFNKVRERLARRVAASLETTPSGQGACIFIVAAKGGG